MTGPSAQTNHARARTPLILLRTLQAMESGGRDHQSACSKHRPSHVRSSKLLKPTIKEGPHAANIYNAAQLRVTHSAQRWRSKVLVHRCEERSCAHLSTCDLLRTVGKAPHVSGRRVFNPLISSHTFDDALLVLIGGLLEEADQGLVRRRVD